MTMTELIIYMYIPLVHVCGVASPFASLDRVIFVHTTIVLQIIYIRLAELAVYRHCQYGFSDFFFIFQIQYIILATAL